MAQLKTPAGWVALGPAPADHTLELTFAVKQTHTAQLEATLLEVSDPDSASYGQWLSNEDVHALVAPEPASREAVRSFLAAHGAEAHDATPNGDFVTASVTVAQAERMLGATYQAWQHGPSGHVVHRTDRYHLPAHVAAAVDFVSPTVQLPTIAAPRVAERGAAGPSRGNTPDSLRALYGVGSDKGGASPKTKQAVTAFLGQLYNASDLTSFYQKYWPSGDASKIGMVGDAPPGLGGVESMLDIEYVTGMGGDVPTEFWGFTGHAPDNKENEPFLKWLQVVDSKPDSSVPQLFSTSCKCSRSLCVFFEEAQRKRLHRRRGRGQRHAGLRWACGRRVPEDRGARHLAAVRLRRLRLRARQRQVPRRRGLQLAVAGRLPLGHSGRCDRAVPP